MTIPPIYRGSGALASPESTQDRGSLRIFPPAMGTVIHRSFGYVVPVSPLFSSRVVAGSLCPSADHRYRPIILTAPRCLTNVPRGRQVDKEHRLASRAGEAFGGAMDGVSNAMSKKDGQDERWGSRKN